jgi:hypothetical protein
MTLWAKFATVFLCAAICALALGLLPRENNQRQTPRQPATPVLLKENKSAAWLLV